MATRSLKNKEGDIQNSICEYLEMRRKFFFRLNNIPAFNRNAGGGVTMRRLPKYTPRGLPDIIVVAGGLFIALEVKSAIGRQSPEQKVIEEQIKKHGGQYHVVRSIEDVQAIGL